MVNLSLNRKIFVWLKVYFYICTASLVGKVLLTTPRPTLQAKTTFESIPSRIYETFQLKYSQNMHYLNPWSYYCFIKKQKKFVTDFKNNYLKFFASYIQICMDFKGSFKHLVSDKPTANI